MGNTIASNYKVKMGCNHIESRRMRRELAEVDFDVTASYQFESKELCKNCRTTDAPVTLAKNIFLGDSGSKDATVSSSAPPNQ